MAVPLYVIEPDYWSQSTTSARQWRFVSRALAALRAQLAVLGAPLVVRVGNAVDVLEELRAGSRQMALWSHEETGDGWTFARDQQVNAWAQAKGVPWHEFPQAGVVRKLQDRDAWVENWHGRMTAAPLPPPPGLLAHGLTPGKIVSERILDLDDDDCEDIPAGPTPARRLLDGFLTSRAEYYSEQMSLPSVAADACSRLSPHLAYGTISTREALHAAQLARGNHPPGAFQDSIDSFILRLQWRCHLLQKLEGQPEIEHQCFHAKYEGLWDDENSQTRLDAWLEGRTGFPLVDASMRALRATGWLNFRMRAMCVSVAAHQLWLDWRVFGPPLARLFTDYEPGIHWSQCQMQSGVTGANTPRISPPAELSRAFDPDGTFIRQWVPELADVPTQFIHEPWTPACAGQAGPGPEIASVYPAPIVDPVTSTEAARARLAAVSRDPEFAELREAILRKHGLRHGPEIARHPIDDGHYDLTF